MKKISINKRNKNNQWNDQLELWKLSKKTDKKVKIKYKVESGNVKDQLSISSLKILYFVNGTVLFNKNS